MSSTVIASMVGTGLRPGVSKNRRYYSTQLIGRLAERAQARIEEDGRPLTMRVAHPDPDTQHLAPVTETAGRLTSVRQVDDGSLRFTADLYDSKAGRDVLALYDTRGQKPAVRSVSIRGRWLGDVMGMLVDGVQCEAADDLELDGIDFTHLPGVEGAGVERVFSPGQSAEALALASGGYIYESCPAGWQVLEIEDQQSATDPVLASAIAKLRAGQGLAQLPRGEWQAASTTYLRDVFAPRARTGRA